MKGVSALRLPVGDRADLNAMRRAWVDSRLQTLLPPAGTSPQPLTDAVREACLGRGKRVRPILAMLSAAHFGGAEEAALDFACALELIHSASLVLDDLPCMDDAAMRRGHPTLHRRFGEDVAVLGAVALLNHSYGVIGRDRGLSAETRLGLTMLVSDAVGFGGLVSGQIRDLHEPKAIHSEAALTSLNHEKTGALFVAAAVGGALIAGASPSCQNKARLFAGCLGLAFQLWDDLQDLTSTSEAMGKDAGQDAGRVTFVDLWGADRTRAAIGETIEAGLESLGDSEGPLAQFSLNLFRHAGYGG